MREKASAAATLCILEMVPQGQTSVGEKVVYTFGRTDYLALIPQRSVVNARQGKLQEATICERSAHVLPVDFG